MAVLADAHRDNVSAEWMRENFGPVSITKAEVRAAIGALDDFLDTSKGAINSAIPQPARGALSTRQKIELLRFVLGRRLTEGSDT